MKWIFLLALMIGTPALAGWLRSSPRYLVHTCFAIGLLMFSAVPSLWSAPIPWPGWPGPVQGLEISFLDGISVAIIYATRPVQIPWTVKLAVGIICIALIVSTSISYLWMPPIFYAWQFFRTCLLFVAIARVCASNPKASIALIGGLGAALVYEAGLAFYEYMNGAERPGGHLGHSNFLGFSSHFVIFPTLALMLGTRRTVWPAIVVTAGLVIAVVGGSRATLAMYGLGIIITVILSLRRRVTSRKSAFAGAAAMMLLISAPAMMWAANRRTEAAKVASDDERGAMKLAARMMIADHPFGVGADQYVVVANTGGYSARAGVSWTPASRAAPVHNTYYLVMAETGFIGLIGLLSLLAAFIAAGLSLLRRRSDEDCAELIPGLLAAMIATCFHLAFEWVFMHFVLHYLFAIAAGMMVGVGARMAKPAKRTALAGTQMPLTSAAT